MKRIRNIFFCVFILSIISCNTTLNDVDNECTVIESDLVSSAEFALADLESNIKSALNESQNIDDFRKNLLAKEEENSRKLNLESENHLKSGLYTTDEVDSLSRKFLDDFKASIFYEFEANNVEGSRDEFILFLDQKKQEFQDAVAGMDFLDQQEKKDFLIAQMIYEVGVLELIIKYSDDISVLVQNSDSDNIFKSASSCNWWCKTKLYAKCIMLTEGLVISIAIVNTPFAILGVIGTGALSWLAADCWLDFYHALTT